MKSWKQALCLATLSLILFNATSVKAQCPQLVDPCDWYPCALQCLTLGGEVLYWKPCVNDLDVLFTFNAHNTEVDFDDICLEWAEGFRFYVSYQNPIFCDWIVKSSWAHIRPRDSEK